MSKETAIDHSTTLLDPTINKTSNNIFSDGEISENDSNFMSKAKYNDGFMSEAPEIFSSNRLLDKKDGGDKASPFDVESMKSFKTMDFLYEQKDYDDVNLDNSVVYEVEEDDAESGEDDNSEDEEGVI